MTEATSLKKYIVLSAYDCGRGGKGIEAHIGAFELLIRQIYPEYLQSLQAGPISKRRGKPTSREFPASSSTPSDRQLNLGLNHLPAFQYYSHLSPPHFPLEGTYDCAG